jgi:spermidine/putrescine transport system permease protein
MADQAMDSPDNRQGAQARLAIAAREIEKTAIRTRLGLLAPAVLVIVLFGIFPLGVILAYSFMEPGAYGGVKFEFSTDAYVQFLFEEDLFDETLQFNTAYVEIFSRSIGLAIFSTVGSLLVGFPTAYFIATKPREQRNLWLFLITLPFWTNLLIRTFAMLLIIRDEGVINIGLQSIGVIDSPITMLYTDFAVCLGLIYSYLPFMVLPLYASLEKLDFRLVEAAYDLYATRLQVLKRIIVPMAKPGVVAGCILVFIPCLGAYITPELLGGGKKLMIGNLIRIQFGHSRNWPFGSAASLILMAIVMLALLLYVRNATAARQKHG